MLESKLSFSSLKIHLRAEADCILPEFTGSTIRGTFGHALKTAFCVMHHRDCANCLVSDSCGYYQIFESQDNTKSSLGFQYKPHPYIIRPSKKSKFQIGEHLTFEFIIFGEYKSYIPYIVYAFDLMGKQGFGKDRNPFILESVQDSTSHQELYIDGRFHLDNLNHIDIQNYLGSELSNQTLSQINIQFITPVRIEKKNKLQYNLDTELFWETVFRRYKNMHTFYGQFIETDLNIQLCSIETVQQKDKKWQRYSNRQRRKVEQGGILGVYKFKELDTKAYRILKTIELIHLGKNTSFGLGQILVTSNFQSFASFT